ncbi:hypothetical protein BDZ91DRAFT_779395 [Kalaharituber pfeilii]|nr:hypothetical protein BDZ91DRAFT_779395 [Kalaharituber pfeilii]
MRVANHLPLSSTSHYSRDGRSVDWLCIASGHEYLLSHNLIILKVSLSHGHRVTPPIVPHLIFTLMETIPWLMIREYDEDEESEIELRMPSSLTQIRRHLTAGLTTSVSKRRFRDGACKIIHISKRQLASLYNVSTGRLGAGCRIREPVFKVVEPGQYQSLHETRQLRSTCLQATPGKGEVLVSDHGLNIAPVISAPTGLLQTQQLMIWASEFS